MIRQASPEDLSAIVELRAEASAWLRKKGSDQWDDTGLDQEAFRERVESSIHHGETWVIERDGAVVGTIAIDNHSDQGLWTDEELAESVIIHRMITARTAPRGIGRQLIDLAREVAYRAGKRYVRLDAWNSNTALHRYYERAGFRYVRTSTDHGTPSGTLYELESRAADDPEIAKAATT